MNKCKSFERKLLTCSKSQRPKWLKRLRREMKKASLAVIIIFVWHPLQIVPANCYRRTNCPTAVLRVSRKPVEDRDRVIAAGGRALVYYFR